MHTTITTPVRDDHKPTLQDEFALLAQKIPTFDTILFAAIEQGTIQGNLFCNDDDEQPAGCAYGNLCQFDRHKAIDLAFSIRTALYGGILETTPMEKLVPHVNAGETHVTNEALALLYKALQDYRATLPTSTHNTQ